MNGMVYKYIREGKLKHKIQTFRGLAATVPTHMGDSKIDSICIMTHVVLLTQENMRIPREGLLHIDIIINKVVYTTC